MKTIFFSIFSMITFLAAHCQKGEKSSITAVNSNYNSKIIGSSLVGYYPFNHNAKDLTSDPAKGKVHKAKLIADRHGKSRRAYKFNGVNAYINAPQFGNKLPTNEISVSLWARTDVSKSAIALSLGDDYSRFGIAINYSHHGQNSIFWDFGWRGAGGEAPGRLYQLNAPFDQDWHNYVFVSSISQNVMKIYKDGILIVQNNQPLNMLNSAGYELNIGKGINNICYQGSLDEIKIFNYPLNDSEVITLFNE